ncbi:MAG: formylglycine-generating enzyme family protein [Bacteroidota bacterium]
MKPQYLFLLSILLAFFACQSEPQTTVEKMPASELNQEGLDLSNTTPIHNTPSRVSTNTQTNGQYGLGQPEVGTIIQTLDKKQAVPNGMVFVPGGEVEQGSDNGLTRELPTMQRRVQAFFMDIHPVTVAQFRDFVKQTGYVTQAEQFGNSIVFDLRLGDWTMRDGANYQFPLGPKGDKAPDDHPATHISWNDAQAYAKWAGKRLPTETEFEHAARNAKNTRAKYSWGEDIKQAGAYHANIWQGNFPYQNTGEDGYLYTSPVGSFNENELGLQDMSGNVWEWCQDWYKTYGPDSKLMYDNTATREPEKVMRGGSFMCDPSYCHGYRVSGRSGSTPESGLFHLGFRCVKDIEIKL